MKKHLTFRNISVLIVSLLVGALLVLDMNPFADDVRPSAAGIERYDGDEPDPRLKPYHKPFWDDEAKIGGAAK